jgi:predicted porin
MKRLKLAGTALALACGGAFAQSSVTIYGTLDLPVEHLTNTGGGSLTRLPGLTGSVPSRLGFRGVEDLGGGLRALFVLEEGISVDSGSMNQGGRAFGRQSWVGLANEWGTLSLGRQYSMLFWSQTDADILGPNMFGSGSLDNYLPNARVDNAIAYRGTFGGFTLGGTWSPGRDSVNAGPSPSGTNCPGESATDVSACREWSLLARYDAKEWGVAAAIDRFNGGPGAFAGLTSSSMVDQRATLDGWVRFNDLKLGAGLIRRHNDGSPATPHSDLWYLGAGYPVGPVLLEAEYFKLDFRNSPNGATLWALRSTYNLSKRSALYATAGHIDNSGTTALSVSNAAAGGTPPAGGAQTGIGIGIRHSF